MGHSQNRGSGWADGGEEDCWTSIKVNSDAAPVAGVAEYDFDAAAAPVPSLVISDRFVAGFRSGMALAFSASLISR